MDATAAFQTILPSGLCQSSANQCLSHDIRATVDDRARARLLNSCAVPWHTGGLTRLCRLYAKHHLEDLWKLFGLRDVTAVATPLSAPTRGVEGRPRRLCTLAMYVFASCRGHGKVRNAGWAQRPLVAGLDSPDLGEAVRMCRGSFELTNAGAERGQGLLKRCASLACGKPLEFWQLLAARLHA